MLYVTEEKNLYTNSGEFIKHIECPLASKLAREISSAQNDREFYCSKCSTKVKNLRFMTDAETLSITKENPNTCFFATEAANNVVHLTSPSRKNWDSSQKPVIKTARTLDEINFAARNGFKLAFRIAPIPSGERDQVALYKNELSGQYEFSRDMRAYSISDDGDDSFGHFSKIINYFSYPVFNSSDPIAAYVIPPYLPPNSEVFVIDVIEDLLSDGPQGCTERHHSWYAIWDGIDIKFHPHPTGSVLG